VQQIRQRSQRAHIDHVLGRPRVGPPGRHQRLAAIGEHDQQLQHAVPTHPTQHSKDAALERMASPDHPHRGRQRLETGSVSRLRYDTVPWDLVLKAVAHHTDQKWILLYVERWLKAPLQQPDGSLVARDRGTPLGSAISPLLANLFMHYAFDAWMVRELPGISFERYCDDVVVHCRSEKQARYVRNAIAARLAQVGLELHPDKTRIVYCKDADRRGCYEFTKFTFLGYEFRPRLAKNKRRQELRVVPARGQHRGDEGDGPGDPFWHLAKRSDKFLNDLARMFNSVVQGWINYYGRFYKSRLLYFLRRLNNHLVWWVCRNYKQRLRNRERRAMAWLAEIARRSARLFAHWRFGARPDGWAMGAG
jgi:RNA-directed DNA polymerase